MVIRKQDWRFVTTVDSLLLWLILSRFILMKIGLVRCGFVNGVPYILFIPQENANRMSRDLLDRVSYKSDSRSVMYITQALNR